MLPSGHQREMGVDKKGSAQHICSDLLMLEESMLEAADAASAALRADRKESTFGAAEVCCCSADLSRADGPKHAHRHFGLHEAPARIYHYNSAEEAVEAGG